MVSLEPPQPSNNPAARAKVAIEAVIRIG